MHLEMMAQTFLDLEEDFKELLVLATDAYNRCRNHQDVLLQKSTGQNSQVQTYLAAQTEALQKKYQDILKEIETAIESRARWQEEHIRPLIQLKKDSFKQLRTLQGILAATLAADNWQSPSFEYAQESQAGTQTDTIGLYNDDYKRDSHRDERTFARLFIRENVDSKLPLQPHAYLTSSGMSAFSTVLNHLSARYDPKAAVLVGLGCYFQNRHVAEKIFPKRITYFNEFETDATLQLAVDIQPMIVIINSLSNSHLHAIPDFATLLPRLVRVLPSSATIVIDNTCMATMFQPLHLFPVLTGRHLIVVESLLKYHQFGFDRVNGGIIWTTDLLPVSLAAIRRDFGTIMSDISVFNMPIPHRNILDRRLRRIGRNARMLAEALDAQTANKGTIISNTIHPSLPSYPGYRWTKDLPFHGGSFSIEIAPWLQNKLYHRHLVRRATTLARKKDTELIGGSSFGFNSTRIYPIPFYAAHRQSKNPSIRISAGTETLLEIDRMSIILQRTFEHP